MTYAWVLRLMMSLVVTEPPRASWADTYEATAREIARATDGDPEMAAILVAIGWYESRFNPRARDPRDGASGVWQIVPHWGTPSAATAAWLVTESRAYDPAHQLAWFACGDTITPHCQAISSHRMHLAARLLARMPQERPSPTGRPRLYPCQP